VTARWFGTKIVALQPVNYGSYKTYKTYKSYGTYKSHKTCSGNFACGYNILLTGDSIAAVQDFGLNDWTRSSW
jgi:hypothetical protein